MVSSKHAFWQALIFTIIVFIIGIILGYYLENLRADKLNQLVINSEINLLDEQLRNNAVPEFNVSCNLSTQGLFSFADKIYSEAALLEEYDGASTLTTNLKSLHRRYDLLRFSLWAESVKLKERCPSDYHTVVYFYDYKTTNLEQNSEQAFFERLLTDLKQKYSNKVLLIPMAANLDLDSINLVLNEKKVTKIPAVLVDENKIIDSTSISFEDFEKIVFSK